MSVGQRLREVREQTGLSLGQVAQYEEIGRQYLSKLELGTNNPPAWELLRRLARRYHVSADYLLGLVDDPAGRRDLSPELQEIARIWAELDNDQRRLVLDTMKMLVKVRTPHVIGGEEKEPKEQPL
ncbi:MAG: hypothetical protein BroJett021_28240 [Chloroflexota bacterium]|nr:MAG: hypothetical protein BroJett021_28240 [Chloroflexota bacterium]